MLIGERNNEKEKEIMWLGVASLACYNITRGGGGVPSVVTSLSLCHVDNNEP